MTGTPSKSLALVLAESSEIAVGDEIEPFRVLNEVWFVKAIGGA